MRLRGSKSSGSNGAMEWQRRNGAMVQHMMQPLSYGAADDATRPNEGDMTKVGGERELEWRGRGNRRLTDC